MTRITLSYFFVTYFVSIGCLCSGWQPLHAQTTEVADQVSQSEIDKVKSQIEAETELDPELVAKALGQLKLASDVLTVTEGLKAREVSDATKLQNLDADQTEKKQLLEIELNRKPERLNQLSEEELDELTLEEIQDYLSELEQSLSEKQRNQTEAQTALAKAESSIEERATRIKSIKDRLTQIPIDAAKIDVELTKLESSTEPPLVIESYRLYHLAQRRQLQQEPATLQTELSFLESTASTKVYQTEQKLQSQRLVVVKEEVETWTKEVGRIRNRIAFNRKAKSLALAEEAESIDLKKIFLKNAEIVDQELIVTKDIQEIRSKIQQVLKERQNLEDEFQQVQKREQRVGYSRSFGKRLREQRKGLPIIHKIETEKLTRVSKVEEAQVEYYKRRDDRRALNEPQEVILDTKTLPQRSILDDEELVERSKQLDRQNDLLNLAYQQQRDYLDEIIDLYSEYIEAMDTLDAEQNALIELRNEYAKYIDEKVLWIRSHEALTPALILNDSESIQRLTDRDKWNSILAFYYNDATKSIITYILFIMIWLSLIVTQPYQKATLRACGKQAASRLNTSLTATNRAFLWTIVKSLLLPLPFLFLYYRAIAGQALPEILVLTRHLRLVAVGVFGFEFIRNVCRPFGLGEKHFVWPERVNRLTSLQISSFLSLATPIAIVIAILRSRSDDGDLDSLERICSVAIYILAAYMLHRITSPKHGIASEWRDSHPHSWRTQLMPIFYFVSISIPIGLALLTIAGFSYASQQIAVRLAESFSLVFIVLFLRAYLSQWLILGQRRRAIKQARELRAQLENTTAQSTSPEPPPDRSNLAEIGEQTRSLLSTVLILLTVIGMWIIWKDMLPALKFFDNWRLPGTGIALTALLMAIVLGGISLSAARNIPGLLEVLLLERLPLDRSARYAIKAVTQYLIVLLGVLTCCQIIGIGWDQVQWLAAALTFGLGFGLQEIFANFVSGLIILFEQPVRVGDVVTIDNVSGVVNRIRIRSTTITDWDRKEYIVPNKEFITGRLLNWTLSDTINRIIIEVGVAYGSDVDQVIQVLNDVAENTDDILKDPPHIITFKGFGESSLDFEVRVFLPVIEKRLDVISALHTDIYKALDAAKIEIPFPQRDLHVRSITALSKTGILEELQNSQPDAQLNT